MKKNLAKLLIVIMIILTMPLDVAAEDSSCIHQWSEWETEYEPTCGSEGRKSHQCLECSDVEYQSIPATGIHTWSNWYIEKNPTISKTGLQVRECSICQKEQTQAIAKLKPFAKFSKKTVKVTKSQSKKLKVSYAKGDSIKKWKSSNKKVVTVSKSGKITAKKKGTAKITVTMKSGKKATCTIKVSNKKKPSKGKANKGTVYWTPSGKVYHSTKNCPTLSRSRTIKSGSKSKCPKTRACKVCY